MCFDIDRFVDRNLASHFTCSICQFVLCCPQANKTRPTSKQEPIHINEAGHKYCEKCIVDWLNTNESCPYCRKHLEIRDLQTIDRCFLNILKELQIRCKYFSKGCQFTAKLESIEQHELAECQYGVEQCVNCGIIYGNQIHTERDCIKSLIETIKLKDNKIKESCKQVEISNDEIEKLKDEINEIKSRLELKNNEINKNNIDIKILNYEINRLKSENDELIKLINDQRYVDVSPKLDPKQMDKPKIKTLTHHQNTVENKHEGSGQFKTKQNKIELIDLCASKEENFDRINELIKQENANVDYNYHGKTPLIEAIKNGHTKIVQLLVESNANVDVIDNEGCTALFWASFNGHKHIVQLLIESKANVNKKNNYGQTALMKASYIGHKGIVKLLIENNANVNEKDLNGETALRKAKTEEIKTYLKSNGAKYIQN